MLSCISYLNILDVNPLSEVSFANIFSHLLSCLFILFVLSFPVQMLFSLMQEHLFIFAFFPLAWGDRSKKILLRPMLISILPMFSSRNSLVSGLTFKSFSFFFFLDLFIYFWLLWVFTAAHGFSLVVAGGGCSLVVVCRLLLLQSMSSRCVGSVVVAHRLCWSKICGIFPTRDWAHVPCSGRWILNHWTTREALAFKSLIHPMFILCTCESSPVWFFCM